MRVGGLNLGTVGNRKHTYFFVWPKLARVATSVLLKDCRQIRFQIFQIPVGPKKSLKGLKFVSC